MIAKEFNIRLKKPGEPAAAQTKYPQAPLSVAGSPDAIAQHLDQYRQAGLEYAVCAFKSEGADDLLRQMRVFAEQVVPQLGEAVSTRECPVARWRWPAWSLAAPTKCAPASCSRKATGWWCASGPAWRGPLVG